MRMVCALAVCILLALLGAGAASAAAVPPQIGIWLTQPEIQSLPTSGAAWNAVHSDAYASWSAPNISNQDDMTDVMTFAGALVYQRTGDEALRAKVASTIAAAEGTERGARALALGRNLIGYVLAADLINLHAYSPSADQTFRSWLSAVRTEGMSGGPNNLIACNNERPNNWGMHCGASRIAADLYLGDNADLANAARVFQGWCGDRTAYTSFAWGDESWQSDPSHPVGINPPGATIAGENVDGVLPDDQRRSGGFTWPPPKENYVWEALQGATAQAYMLHRVGYDSWNWSTQAIRRAISWLYNVDQFPATGDDTWEPWLINFAYGTQFPTVTPTSPGKNVGYTDWTFAGRTLASSPPPTLGSPSGDLMPVSPLHSPSGSRGGASAHGASSPRKASLAVGMRVLSGRRVLSTGRLVVRVHCAAACALKLTATVGGRRHARLATRSMHLAADRRATVRVRLNRHALAGARSATVVVAITARSPSGAVSRMRRTARITL